MLSQRFNATHVFCFHEGMDVRDVMCYIQTLQFTPSTLVVVFIGIKEFTTSLAALRFSLKQEGKVTMEGMWQEW